jgi:hypothetical protein
MDTRIPSRSASAIRIAPTDVTVNTFNTAPKGAAALGAERHVGGVNSVHGDELWVATVARRTGKSK